jgi:MarR family transcriptional regulator, lower aerobic nicotinate degradation pathway regulator
MSSTDPGGAWPEAGLTISERPADAVADALGGFTVEDHIGYLLRRAHQRHVSIFTTGMAHVELTPTQFTALLKTVELGRITQNHLGRLAAMDPATIQGVVRRLTARGLMRRSNDKMDRRTAVLEPTEAGVALIASVVSCARKAHEQALAPLSAAERIQVMNLLRKMG